MKFALSVLTAFWAVCAGFSQTPVATLPSISPVAVANGKVFFAATDDTYGQELFVSNGKPGNSNLVKDINPGYGGSSPANFTVLGNELFFTANSLQYGLSLWKTDGTPAGTTAVYTVKDADPAGLFVFKDKLYFTTALGTIVRTDGTAQGTAVFYQADFTWGRIQTVIADEEYIYFTSDGRKIFRDNGTSRIYFLGPLSWEDVYFKRLFAVGHSLVAIKSSTYDEKIRIYAIDQADIVNDGDAEWPVIKKLDAPIYGSQAIESFTNVAGKLFFNFRTDYDNVPATDELWVTDGTEAGTKQLKSFAWDSHWWGSEMGNFYSLHDKLFFRGGNATGQSLWTSDGTAAGTVRFHNVAITRLPGNDEVAPLKVTDSHAYFSGTLGDAAGLWTSDGTAAGTTQLFPLQTINGTGPHDFAVGDDAFYFVTSKQFSSTLWSSTPAADISVSLGYSDLTSGSSASPFWGAAVGSCQTANLTITNQGLATLYLNQVTLAGNDFYLGRKVLPGKLSPGESFTTSLVFNPVTPAKSTAILTILSNDTDEATFTVNLSATPYPSSATQACLFDPNNYVKNLTANQPQGAIMLSPSAIAEGQPAGTVIGTLDLPANATFLLVAGEGDADNDLFSLDGKILKSAAVFNFDQRSLYSIRVRATAAGHDDIEASLRIRIINGSPGFEAGNCQPAFTNMNFSYLELEANAEGHLFTTTSSGQILRSKDQGQHWEIVYAGPQYPALSEITFHGNTGIVQGSQLLKSDDGGASWFHLYLPLTNGAYYYRPPAIFFFDEQTGYAGTTEGEIFFTNDGGRTWETRLSDSWHEFNDLFFLSAETGYAISGFGDLSKTTDGGRTWTAVDLSSLGWSTRVRDLWFINGSEGFLLGEYYLYRTVDGGQTWTQVQNVNAGGGKIKFYGTSTGYLYSGTGTVYRTSDGGKTWTPLLYDIPGTNRSVAESGGRIFIANGSYYSSNQSARSLGVSSNNGVTWSSLNTFPGDNLYKINFSTTNKGYILGASGFLQTADGGLTLKQAITDLSAVNDLFFIDENTVIMASGGDIYKSTNGGVTTRNVLTTPKSEPYLPAGGLYSAPGNILFSVSWYAVYRSSDLGETWQLVSTDPGYYTQGMCFVSSTTGYRIELFGSIEKTTDGGETWTSIFTRDPNASDPFNAIFYLDENLGYSGGAYLRKTTDGGVTWQRINYSFYDIIAIHFENPAHGYVVTRGGRIYETADEGQTWKEMLYTSYQFSDVEFRDNEIFIAGTDGLAMRTNLTPRPPSIPGYLSGPERICAGDAIDFHLAVDYGYQTQWATTAGSLDDHNDYATVYFPTPGTYTITARHFNGCGVSDLRTTTVQVATPQDAPVIDGPNPANQGEKAVAYTITNAPEHASYLWEVQGSAKFSPSENEVLVDWSTDAEQGDIKVLATDAAGCRSSGELTIALLQAPVAVEPDITQQVRVYPNPAGNTDTRLASSYNGTLAVRVVDVVGREQFRTSIQGGEEQSMPTRHLSSGLYLVEISNGTHVVTKKLIKK